MNIARTQPGIGARLAGTSLLAAGLLTAGLVLASPVARLTQKNHTEPEQSTDAEQAQKPIPIVRFHPRYPKAAAEEGITGSVTLEGRVLDDGSVSDIKVVASTPPGVFDEEAVAAFSRWRFDPTQGGRREIGQGLATDALTVRQTIEFQMDEEPKD